ncbi:hypothetical protein GQ44DRAFT_774028 [Phaeosphaeriaceae sp. PMI808]|nr:hypothetical protein GQ44DRAFT_774028 [Phaeosphaeriaceae sp. PMI808]
MYCSLIFSITLLASLFSNVLAFGTLYRGDNRDPATIKAAGGFNAFRTSGPCGTDLLKQHSSNRLGSNDPFVSTSQSMERAEDFERAYVYYIDSSKITNQKWDVNTYVPDGITSEVEVAVCYSIPWSAVISVQQQKGSSYVPINMPKKRAAFAHDARARAEVQV